MFKRQKEFPNSYLSITGTVCRERDAIKTVGQDVAADHPISVGTPLSCHTSNLDKLTKVVLYKLVNVIILSSPAAVIASLFYGAKPTTFRSKILVVHWRGHYGAAWNFSTFDTQGIFAFRFWRRKTFWKKLELKLFLYFLFYFYSAAEIFKREHIQSLSLFFCFVFFLTEKPPSMLFGELNKASLHKLI